MTIPPDAPRAPLDRDRLRAGLLTAGVTEVRVPPRVGSTSTMLLEIVRAGEGDGPVLVATDHQEAGRGRAGHGWQTPPGAALTFSLAVRPETDRASWGWLPLLTGLGVQRGIEAVTGLTTAAKWPNDVLVPDTGPELPGWGRDRKVCGILAEVAPDGRTVVLGIGINVDQYPGELPVPQAASLRTAGATGTDRTALLLAVVAAVMEVVRRDPGPAARAAVRAHCRTLGRPVSADLPGGGRVSGEAVAIDDDGALVLRRRDGSRQRLLAGDVRHVRAVGELGSTG